MHVAWRIPLTSVLLAGTALLIAATADVAEAATTKVCSLRLSRCAAICIKKYDKVSESKESLCLGNCTRAYDTCTSTASDSADTLDPTTDPRPRRPEGGIIPGGGILDSGPGLGTRGPSATGTPLSPSAPAPKAPVNIIN